MFNLISQGLDLMLVGMGTVFVFLGVLIMAIQAMAWLIARYIPVQMTTAGAGGQPTEEELVAITAAIAAHRQSAS